MEGLYFEVKPRRDKALGSGSSDKPLPHFTSTNSRSYSSLLPSTFSKPCPDKPDPAWKRNDSKTWGDTGEEEEEEVQYRLSLIGSLPVHHLTTMAMLPWVVAEIGRARSMERDPGAGFQSGGSKGGPLDTPMRNQTVFLCVSASRVQCVRVWDERLAWDPLSHTVLFQCRPHQVTKLIHNSQEPSSFGCLVRDTLKCGCYVFQCQDSTKV
ncbi:hypothetical protein LDENG_00114530 [Lucifuga dentata]|nr:hypothetical protein LDENG_00114530 [Lucifuga dentata]